MKCCMCNEDNATIFSNKTGRDYCKDCFKKRKEKKVEKEVNNFPENIKDVFPWMK